jgi:hypothetical protein
MRTFKNLAGDKIVIDGMKITMYHASTTPNVSDEDKLKGYSDIFHAGCGSIREYVAKLRKLGFKEVEDGAD